MSVIRRHPYAVTIATLLMIVVISAAIPTDDMLGTALQTALPALGVVGVLMLVDRRRLRLSARGTHAFPWAPSLYLVALGLLVLIPSLAALVTATPEERGAVDWGALPYLIVICVGTGYLEEGFFRGLLTDAFITTLKPGRHALLHAAVISSSLFGLLHVVGTGQATDTVSIASLIAKPIEAGIFGFFMTAVYVRTSSISAPALLHAFFDLALLAPSYLTLGSLPDTYVTSDGPALAGLVIVIVALLPLFVWAYRAISTAEFDYRPQFAIRPEREEGPSAHLDDGSPR